MGQHLYTGPHGTTLKAPQLRFEPAAKLDDIFKHHLGPNLRFPVAAVRVDGNYAIVTFGKDEQGQQIAFKGHNTWAFFAAADGGPPHAVIKSNDEGHSPDGGERTTRSLAGVVGTMPDGCVTDADIRMAAEEIGIEPRAMKAVIAIEAAGSGFLPNGKPKILFEAQWFGLFTDDKYNLSHPDISLRAWDPNQYIGGEGEWGRLEKAAQLDREAAYKSASYGLGQIMGFHYDRLGYADIFSFSEDMHRSEGRQLLAMAKFIGLHPDMVEALKTKNWAKFAHAYNGEGYRTNRYDEKLAAAYATASFSS